MMYPLVRELADDGIPVTVTCRVLNIARQPYYRWLAAPVTDREWHEAHLANALFDANKARECGIVNHVVADADVLTQTLAKARQLAEQPPATLRQCKKLLREAIREPAMAAFKREVAALDGMIKSNAEAMEAMTAFMQKRKPDFSKFR